MFNPYKVEPVQPMMIAGHSYTIFNGRCACGRELVDITHVTEADIGKADIAHSGTLTTYEYAQIEAYRSRLLLAAAS
jgi:hypothetical protein